MPPGKEKDLESGILSFALLQGSDLPEIQRTKRKKDLLQASCYRKFMANYVLAEFEDSVTLEDDGRTYLAVKEM